MPAIQRSVRTRLIVNSIFFALAVSGFLVPWKYWTCFFRGPRVVDDQFLLDAQNSPTGPSQLIEYVQIGKREVSETNWRRQVSRNEKELYADPFYVMNAGDKLLLVHAESPGSQLTIVGPFYRIGSPTERQVYETLLEEHPEWKDRLLPLMINGKAVFSAIGYMGLVVLLPTLGVTLFNLIRAARSPIRPAVA